MAEIIEKVTSDEIISFKYPEYKDMNDDDKHDFWSDLSEEDKYAVNQITTKVNGYGQDRLFINESSRENDLINITQFKNLFDWDVACWNLQRDWCKSDNYHPYDKGEYNFNKSMTGEWIRFIEDSRLVYASLYSLRSFMWWKIEELVLEIENELIPHEYKWDPSLDEECDESGDCGDDCHCRKVNITINAHGREEEYEKLRKLTYKYISGDNLAEAIIAKLTDGFRGTFRIDNFENPIDPYSDLIVCDKETLEKIKPESFLNDFKEFLIDNSLIDDLLNGLKIIIQQDYRNYIKENM